MIDPAPYAGPIVITLGIVLLYYAFMIRQAREKFRLGREYRERGEKFDRYFSNDREMLAADRIVLNLLEHMPVFLVLMWLDAVFHSPTSATIAGGIYLAARIAYPFLMGGRLGRSVRASIFVATLPGYLVILYFVLALLYTLVV